MILSLTGQTGKRFMREKSSAKQQSQGSLHPVVLCVAWGALLWGIIGGWEILGQWWPKLNTITKDQVTIIVASIAILWRSKRAPNDQAQRWLKETQPNDRTEPPARRTL